MGSVRRPVRIGVLAAVLVFGCGLFSVGPAGASTSTRGFNGKTITVAGLFSKASFTGAEVGTEAYFQQLNKTNYLRGVKIKFLTVADDQSDPAVALTAARQLVTQYQVFAIVPDLSAVNPVTYLTAQKVPYVGEAFDGTYCSSMPSTTLWGFGYNGCLLPTNPSRVPDGYSTLYNYVKAKTGNSHPTVALFSANNASGAQAAKLQTVSFKGAGFNVVYARAAVPPVASDYTPYVQQLMTAANGKQPSTVYCLLAVQCVAMWKDLQNSGFTGTYGTPLGSVPALIAGLQGTVSSAFYNIAPNAGLTAMTKAINAVAPGTQLAGYSNVPGYFAASMFALAVHNVQVKKQPITPSNVQKALAVIKWQIPGLVGPITYPASTVEPTPFCGTFIAYTGGSIKVVSPYRCSSKSFKVTPQAERAG
jgi:ABC-type branched-subunit amino acid transport system substrate-binding protein